ncbi:hypothetical protein HGM15179_006532 [Zosterops borbonicus]|uniref:Uncharacterized protein n=1 Tax=Zosterops borbonicus TaxID=364589 RepID=A0A8K1GKE7_9PASS|nr:hypothetical protein HGM15179_006532 [Zosterops borbonicus]
MLTPPNSTTLSSCPLLLNALLAHPSTLLKDNSHKRVLLKAIPMGMIPLKVLNHSGDVCGIEAEIKKMNLRLQQIERGHFPNNEKPEDCRQEAGSQGGQRSLGGKREEIVVREEQEWRPIHGKGLSTSPVLQRPAHLSHICHHPGQPLTPPLSRDWEPMDNHAQAIT